MDKSISSVQRWEVYRRGNAQISLSLSLILSCLLSIWSTQHLSDIKNQVFLQSSSKNIDEGENKKHLFSQTTPRISSLLNTLGGRQRCSLSPWLSSSYIFNNMMPRVLSGHWSLSSSLLCSQLSHMTHFSQYNISRNKLHKKICFTKLL